MSKKKWAGARQARAAAHNALIVSMPAQRTTPHKLRSRFATNTVRFSLRVRLSAHAERGGGECLGPLARSSAGLLQSYESSLKAGASLVAIESQKNAQTGESHGLVCDAGSFTTTGFRATEFEPRARGRKVFRGCCSFTLDLCVIFVFACWHKKWGVRKSHNSRERERA